MPQNKDTWFQEKAIPLPSLVNDVGRSANQFCVSANVSVTQTPRTMMIAMTLVWMTVKELMTFCKTSWLWLP